MHKADYVRSQGQTRKHHCHWPGCNKQVPPAMWGCKAHWFKLPLALRNRIWAAYRPGQELTMTPSEEYIAVAQEAQTWIAIHEANLTPHDAHEVARFGEFLRGPYTQAAYERIYPEDTQMRSHTAVPDDKDQPALQEPGGGSGSER